MPHRVLTLQRQREVEVPNKNEICSFIFLYVPHCSSFSPFVRFVSKLDVSRINIITKLQ